MARNAKTIRLAAGGAVAPGTATENPAVPVNTTTLVEAVLQLQNTVNEVISRLNSHTHSSGAVAAPDVATRVQGTAVAATNLFTND